VNPEERALNACVEYAKQSALIKDRKREIFERTHACYEANGGSVTLDGGSHLSMAISHRVIDTYDSLDEPDTCKAFLTNSERQTVLNQCQHCALAYEAIQIRKAARKALGNAKRAITLFGKARWEHMA